MCWPLNPVLRQCPRCVQGRFSAVGTCRASQAGGEVSLVAVLGHVMPEGFGTLENPTG